MKNNYIGKMFVYLAFLCGIFEMETTLGADRDKTTIEVKYRDNNKGLIPIEEVALADDVKASEANIIHQDLDVLLKKFDEAKEVLQADPAYLELKDGEKYVVIGDIHGDIISLEMCLAKYLPEVKNGKACLLFLGDYNDRGPNSLEVMTKILELKKEYKNRIFLLRGNHETDQRSQNGFRGDLKWSDFFSKYGKDNAETLLKKLYELFDELPICANIYDTYFCAHAGIPDNFKLEDFKGLTKGKGIKYSIEDNELDSENNEAIAQMLFRNPLRETEKSDNWKTFFNATDENLKLFFNEALNNGGGYLVKGHQHFLPSPRPFGENVRIINVISSLQLRSSNDERLAKIAKKKKAEGKEITDKEKEALDVSDQKGFSLLIIKRGEEPEIVSLKSWLLDPNFRKEVRQNLMKDFGKGFFYDSSTWYSSNQIFNEANDEIADEDGQKSIKRIDKEIKELGEIDPRYYRKKKGKVRTDLCNNGNSGLIENTGTTSSSILPTSDIPAVPSIPAAPDIPAAPNIPAAPAVTGVPTAPKI